MIRTHTSTPALSSLTPPPSAPTGSPTEGEATVGLGGVTFGKVKSKKVITPVLGAAYDDAIASITANAKAKVQAQPASELVPADVAALVMGIADAKQAAKPKAKCGRKSMLTAAREAVARGELPEMLEFKSEANYTYNRHADNLHKLAVANDSAGLEAYAIGGTNTYSKALRGYRDLLVQYVKGAA